MLNVVLVALPVIGLAYAYACVASPFADCPRCDGRGHPLTKRGYRGVQKCRRCKGSGKRLRFGRRIHNAIIRAGEEARR